MQGHLFHIRLFCLFLCVGLGALFSMPAYAGAWLLPEGEALVIATSDYTTAGTAFNDDRDATLDVNFEKVEARIFAELGATENLTLTAEGAYQDIIFRGLEGKSRFIGPAAIRLGGRVPIMRSSPHKFSFAADLGYQRGGEFVSDGELDYEGVSSTAKLLYGYGWDRAYVDIQAGYLTRFGRGPDTWQLDATVGGDLSDKFSLSASAFGRSTNGDRLDADRIEPTESLKLKASILYWTGERSRLEFGLLQTVAGRNIVKERGVTVGTWRTF